MITESTHWNGCASVHPQCRAHSLLKAAIDASGLSNSAYARNILVRDPRSVRRWLAGGKIPEQVIAWLERTTS